MTAPARGRDDATIRGAVVLVVAIVIGLALLWRSGTGDEDAATTTTRDTTTTEFGATTSSDGALDPIETSSVPEGPTGTQDPALVAVVVFNGTPDRIPGIAREFSDKASAGGYEALPPADAAASTDTTTIYAAAGFEADAEAMRGVLTLPNAIVAAKPAEPLGTGDERADIVVVLGTDYAS
ncbi:MAG TPA: LytR C-terminal domain-containing protein [Acidimicrobiales bacterium]|nr:LytR C-terminal domain-containing protein [Acidimicrobiales bacterium]